MVFVIGAETIPSRLNDWLQKAQPGYYVPFHLVFEDEIPVPEDRLRLLNTLSWSPRVIQGGVVDAANGLIYRYESNAVWMWVTNALLVVIVVGASVGVRFTSQLNFPARPLSRPRQRPAHVGFASSAFYSHAGRQPEAPSPRAGCRPSTP
jgi:hypothetical protein